MYCCTFVAIQIVYHFPIKAISLYFSIVTQLFFKEIFIPLTSGICHLLWKSGKGLPCSYATNWWTVVSLKPCCRYKWIIDLHKRILFAFITPRHFLVPLVVFYHFFLIHLNFLSCITIRYIVNNKVHCNFTKFVIELFMYVNINLHKPKNLTS